MATVDADGTLLFCDALGPHPLGEGVRSAAVDTRLVRLAPGRLVASLVGLAGVAWLAREFATYPMLPVERWRDARPGPLKRVCAMAVKALYVLALGPFYGFRRVYWMRMEA